MWTIPAHDKSPMAGESSTPIEEQYYKLQSQNRSLAEELNSLNDANLKLRTKCAALETNQKKIAASDDAAKLASSLLHENKNRQDYEDLFQSYAGIKREHKALITKHKSSLQVISKLKNEISSLKMRGYGRNSGTSYTPKRHSTGGCKKVLGDVVNAQADGHLEDDEDKENVDTLLNQLTLRLHSAENQLQTLKATTPIVNIDTCSRAEIEESTTKLHLLQSQRQIDQSRIKTQEDKLHIILSLHKEYKARYASVKKELLLYQEENESLNLRISELEESCAELNQGNRFLEKKVQTLCKVTDEAKSSPASHRKSSVVDVWQLQDETQKQLSQKELELKHATKMLQIKELDNQDLRSKVEQYQQRIRVLEYQREGEGKSDW